MKKNKLIFLIIVIFMLVFSKSNLFWGKEVKSNYNEAKDYFKYTNKKSLSEYLIKVKNTIESEKIISYTYTPDIVEHQSIGLTEKTVKFGYYYIEANFEVKDYKSCEAIDSKLANLPIESYGIICSFSEKDGVKNSSGINMGWRKIFN